MSEAALLTAWGLGIALLVLEAVIPGGVVGAIGAVLVAGSVIAAFAVLGPGWGLALLAVSLAVGGALAAFAVRRLSHREALSAPPPDAAAEALLGVQGTAATALRPGGFARLAGRRVDVITAGEPVERGAAVEVIAVRGGQVVVRAVAQ